MTTNARVVAAFLTGLLFLSVADAQVAPGVNCQRDPQRGDVCGLYRDIFGSASAAATGQSFSSGTGYTYGPTYEFNGRADSGSAATFANSGGNGFATFGLLRSSSGVNVGTGGEWLGWNAGGVVNTTVGFNDSLNVTSASRARQSGTVVARLMVGGGLTASSQGFTSSGQGYAQVVAGGRAYDATVSSRGGANTQSGTGIPAEILFNISVQFRPDFLQPFSVQLRTAASASASNGYLNPTAGQGSADYGSTLSWGGIAAVLDASGQPIHDWTMRSSSGFDYSRSFVSQVPEPSSWALLAAGSLLLVRRLRTRQTH